MKVSPSKPTSILSLVLMVSELLSADMFGSGIKLSISCVAGAARWPGKHSFNVTTEKTGNGGHTKSIIYLNVVQDLMVQWQLARHDLRGTSKSVDRPTHGGVHRSPKWLRIAYLLQIGVHLVDAFPEACCSMMEKSDPDERGWTPFLAGKSQSSIIDTCRQQTW